MVNWNDIAMSMKACLSYLRMMWRPTVWDAVVVEGTRLAEVFPHLSLDVVLASGASVDGFGPNGTTPLQVALRDGNYAVARKLLNAGANVDCRNADGATAMNYALTDDAGNWSEQERQVEKVSFLLEHGASVQNLEKHLMHSGNPRLVAPLAKAGMDVSGVCVAVALQSGNESMLDAMWAVVSDKEKIGSRLMQLVVTNDDAESVKRLVARGVDVDVRGASSFTPLHVAVMAQKKEVVGTLIILGADVNAQVLDDNGDTALHLAAALENAEIAAMLVAHGADPKIRNNKGFSSEVYLAAQNIEIAPHNLTRAKMDLARKRRDVLRPVPPA